MLMKENVHLNWFLCFYCTLSLIFYCGIIFFAVSSPPSAMCMLQIEEAVENFIVRIVIITNVYIGIRIIQYSVA